MTKKPSSILKRFGFASPVHNDRPYPASQGKSADRGCDNPLADIDMSRSRLPPSGDE